MTAKAEAYAYKNPWNLWNLYCPDSGRPYGTPSLWGGKARHRPALYLIPYFLIGWDIIYRALRNIRNGQVFDENFPDGSGNSRAFAVKQYFRSGSGDAVLSGRRAVSELCGQPFPPVNLGT